MQLTEKEQRLLEQIREYRTVFCSRDERGLLKLILTKLEGELLKS